MATTGVRIGRCQACGQPGRLEERKALKSLTGYGQVIRTVEVDVLLCAGCARALDAQAVAAQVVSDPEVAARSDMFEQHMANVQAQVARVVSGTSPYREQPPAPPLQVS